MMVPESRKRQRAAFIALEEEVWCGGAGGAGGVGRIQFLLFMISFFFFFPFLVSTRLTGFKSG